MEFPLVGILLWLRHPPIWGVTLLAASVNLFLCLLAAGVVGWGMWPDEADLAWYDWLWQAPTAVASALAALVLAYALLVPLVWAACGDLIAGWWYRREGIPAEGEGIWEGVREGLIFMWVTKGWRIGWSLVVLLSGWTIPIFTPLLAAWSVGHIATMDAWDVAWARRRIGGRDRHAQLRARGNLLLPGAVAGALWLALSWTIVGLLVWWPGLYLGAAWAAGRAGNDDGST